ncbi:hypothetical protein Sste5346_009194 [Sporothrix stenoceras]|uniref:Uncharacterized protein n=1 Tax=Sporothrix stenoceras TaxID=5173 RepID=A0ABR3YL07_9PEZI
MSDELMDVNATTSPPVTVRNFAMPRLRRCPFDIDTIDWRRARKLGAGADGCVYRVYFGDRGPFALKLFWIPDAVVEFPTYSAVHRECQNAALLQMLRASVDQTATTGSSSEKLDVTGPPLVHPNPMDFLTASDNLFSFADEVRRARQKQPPPPELQLVPVTSMPRFAKCHGWLPCNVHELMAKMPRHMRSHGFHVDRKTYRTFDQTRTDFIGIVYEYIPSHDGDETDDGGGTKDDNGGNDSTGEELESCKKSTAPPAARRYNTRSSTIQAVHDANGDNEQPRQARPAAIAASNEDTKDTKDTEDAMHRNRVSAVADFLWLAGFKFCSQPLARNWKNGVLVDHSEIIGPYSSGWQRGPRNTKWSVERLLTPSG